MMAPIGQSYCKRLQNVFPLKSVIFCRFYDFFKIHFQKNLKSEIYP